MLTAVSFANTGTMATKTSIFATGHAIERVLQSSIFGMALLAICGCASTNYQRADAAGASLHKASAKIQAESRAIDVTLVELDDLVNKPGPDLKPQFARYNVSLSRLVAASKRAEKSADIAHQKSAEYFENWDKESADIKYESVRDQSVSRKTQVSTEFNTVDQRYRENQAVIEPLISYLQDIRTALSTDLTVGGIQSVKGLAENAQQNARKVQTALARLSDELGASATRMSSITPRENQPEGGVSDAAESNQQHAQSSTVTP
jgi:Protein of unknown function (DUF2959)